MHFQVWTQTTTQQFSVYVEGTPGDQLTAAQEIERGWNPVLEPGAPLRILVERSFFTKGYCIPVVVILWLIGGLNLMHMLDNGEQPGQAGTAMCCQHCAQIIVDDDVTPLKQSRAAA